VKKDSLVVALLLLLASPVLSQVSDRQNAAKWTCSGSGASVSCSVNLGLATNSGNLLALWTFWESTSAYTTSVGDLATNPSNIFLTAVGPTPQSAASTPTTSLVPQVRVRSVDANLG